MKNTQTYEMIVDSVKFFLFFAIILIPIQYLLEEVFLQSPFENNFIDLMRNTNRETFSIVLASIFSPAQLLFISIIFLFLIRLGTKFYSFLVFFALWTCLSLFNIYNSKSMYFDIENNNVYKFYIKTIQGYELGHSNRFSSEYKVKYKRLTPSIVEDIKYSKRYGIDSINIGNSKDEKYFLKNGSEVFVWYSLKNNHLNIYPHPGVDPETGENLKAANYGEYLKIKEELDSINIAKTKNDLN